MKTDQEALERQFAKMGAKVVLRQLEAKNRGRWRSQARQLPSYEINVETTRKKQEIFSLSFSKAKNVEFSVVQVDRADRHLLLLVKQKQQGTVSKHHYLCGHDERSWFAAAVPNNRGIINVESAKQALKPTEAAEAQKRYKIRNKNLNKRHNDGFIRQGEWFFIPVPELAVNDLLILKNEPIRRGRGKPHIVEFAYRRGGTSVYVCRQYPEGVDKRTYERLIKEKPERKWFNWGLMRKDMEVFAKGKVSHSDHATICLKDWHRILSNTENKAPWIENLVFLD